MQHWIRKTDDGYFYSDDKNDYYLLYKPDLEFLSSDEAILVQESMPNAFEMPVFRTAKKRLFTQPAIISDSANSTKMGIAFCQLPYALHER